MAWIYGIPNFIGLYTYYDDLLEPTYSPGLAGLKKSLWAKATAKAQSNADIISSPTNLKKANTFLNLVAQNERQKEIQVIRAFCEKTKNTFPALEEYLNDTDKITKDPSGFYAELTAAINIARRNTTDYLNELKRIQKNMNDRTRTLQDYKADDYRYRLSGDITSFLNRITGNFNTRIEKAAQEESDNAFSIKVQNMVIRILEKFGLIDKISSGEDFSAIAAALLIQVESEVQKRVDKDLLNNTRKNIDDAIDGVLKSIEDEYNDVLKKKSKAKSPVDKALEDIGSLEFKRITDNAKKVLNLQVDLSQDEAKLHKKINSREQRLAKNSGVRHNQEIIKMRNNVKKNNNLSRNLEFVKFSISGSKDSKHGNINELVLSVLGNGSKVNGNPATDIMTFMFNGDIQVDNAILNKLLNSIGDEYTKAIMAQTPNKDDKEIKDTRQIMIDMNNKIKELIKKAEEQIAKQKDFKMENIFIFHESLKLYSSAETGRNKEGGGFGGRNLSIMSYIDDLYSMQSSYSFPLSRDDLGFIAINLMPHAAAADLKEPLEQYLSLYAGMVMFDDLANMAEEAINTLDKNNQTSSITQIHLYNLNGIYVPASMVLSYISDAANNTAEMIDSGYAAKATIKVPTTNKTYATYMFQRYYADEWLLSEETWQAVAVENNLNTKISITFLAAFKTFINKLNSLKY